MNKKLRSLMLILTLLATTLIMSHAPVQGYMPSFHETDTPIESRSNLDGNGTLILSSSPAGADIYINDIRYEQAVSPSTLELSPGTYKIELKIPGYETFTAQEVSIQSGQITSLENIVQLPELLPATVILVNSSLDNDFDPTVTIETLGEVVTLRRAITAILNDASNTHFRIEFDNTVSEIQLQDWINIWSRGNFTINGDKDRNGTADVTITRNSQVYEFSIAASNIRFIGLKILGTASGEDWTLGIGYSSNTPSHPAFNLQNMYFLGNEFIESNSIGAGNCGVYGQAAVEYGGENSFAITNLVFAGNKFNRANLFTFAGAGDEDYSVIDGYYVVANQFINSGSGILAADAHTWYVFGENDVRGNGGVPGQIKFSEYNIIKNILVSGNKLTLDQNAPLVYISPLSLTVANMGNSNNTIQDVIFRHNTVKLIDPTGQNIHSGISLVNTSIGDSQSAIHYQVPENIENGDNNTLRNVLFEYNDLDFGIDIGFMIANTYSFTDAVFQNGSNNLTENIVVRNNTFRTNRGMTIANYYYSNRYQTALNNNFQEITIENNQIISDPALVIQNDDSHGISIYNAFEKYPEYEYGGEQFYNAYGGVISKIDIKNNTIENFKNGILVTGSYGFQHNNIGVDTVNILNNTILTKPHSQYGIEVNGATLEGYGAKPNDPNTYRNGSKNCFVRNVVIDGNSITSQGGIAAFGTYIDDGYSGSIAGNTIENIQIKNNAINMLNGPEVNPQFLKFPIVIGQISDNWNGTAIMDMDILGNQAKNIVLTNNSFSGYATQILDFSSDKLPNNQTITPNQVLQWLAAKSDSSAGLNVYEWEWYSTPATNGTTDKYVAIGTYQLGSTPVLIFPQSMKVEIEGNFNSVDDFSVFLPTILR